MEILTIDFESFYSAEYSLTKLTTQQYLDDHQFEVIGVAVKKNSEPTKHYTGTKEGTANFLDQFDWANSAMLAHNSMFDASILTWHFGHKPKMILDTLPMGRALHGTEVGGSLDMMTRYYGVGIKGKEVLDAKGKKRKDFTPDEMTAYMAYCRNDVDLTYALFKKMAPKFNKTEIKLIDMTCRMHSEPKLQLDLPVLEEHLHAVKAKKTQLLADAGIAQAYFMSNDKFADLLRDIGIEPPMKTSPRTGKQAYAFAKTDEGMKALLEHEDLRIQTLAAARVGVKSTLEETRTERFIEMAKIGGALPVPLKYYGAMTGRWSATDKINLQNVPRGSTLKKAIVAPDGYVIVGADLSNIELRVGLYFAGQIDKVAMLAEGRDLYRDFIAPIFGVAYEEVNDDQRFIGKTSQLSLIYGTGHKKLRNAIKVLSGKDIGEDLAQTLVNRYRTEYTKVKESWYEGEKVLQHIRDHYIFKFGEVLPLEVMGQHGIILPSGLHLRYPDLHQVEENGRTEWRYKVRKKLERIHGPKCYQNTIQALARCVMGEAMVRINKKYPAALTIHDAVYCVVPEEEADEAKRFIITELRVPPAWAMDLPLDAEGGYGRDLSFKMKKLET
jgi:DNA polymerase